MARYDRIAPLAAPSRETAFPGWLVLRDLEGRERDGELARRARLRFLALRPLRRLLTLGVAGVSAASYARQIEGIREELGHLPARDAERVRLSRYLHEIEGRAPAEMCAAAAGLGDVAEEAGHACAAEEFYRSSIELAQALEEPAAAAAALRRLGMLFARVGRVEDAGRQLAAAAAAAASCGARAEWARAACAGAALAMARGNGAGASSALEQVLEQGRAWGDPEVRSIASAALSETALAHGDAEGALERAWAALEAAPDPARRATALERAGAAFRALGLTDGAVRAYELLLREPLPAADLWRAHADLAATLAEAGCKEEFLAARKRLLRDARMEVPPPRAAAELHLRLARACMAAGAADLTREHAREGLEVARRGGYAELAAALEAIGVQVEGAGARELLAVRPIPGERARQIAAAIEARGVPLPG